MIFTNISVKSERPVDIRNRPRIPVPDEDPYSVAGEATRPTWPARVKTNFYKVQGRVGRLG